MNLIYGAANHATFRPFGNQVAVSSIEEAAELIRQSPSRVGIVADDAGELIHLEVFTGGHVATPPTARAAASGRLIRPVPPRSGGLSAPTGVCTASSPRWRRRPDRPPDRPRRG